MTEEVKTDQQKVLEILEQAEQELSGESPSNKSSISGADLLLSEARGLLPLLQALLLSSSDPLDVQTMATVCEVDEVLVDQALKILSATLDSDGFGFELVPISKGFQLRTKAQFGRFIRTLRQESPRKLSAASLETLAVVAYRQPVVKHDIDGLRGVDVAPTLKTLLERGLVQIVGHRETVGHPSLYGTTDEFLRIFGLNSLEDLPTLRELAQIQIEPGEQGAEAFENPHVAMVDAELKESETSPSDTSESAR